MAAADASWDPLPFPKRKSPFYALSSIAFSKDAPPIEGPRLPRVRPGQQILEDYDVESFQQEQLVLADTAPDTQPSQGYARLVLRRDAALADHKKLDSQLQRVQDRRTEVKKARDAARLATQDLQEQVKKLNEGLKDELLRIYGHQQHLYELKAELEEIQPSEVKFSAAALKVINAPRPASSGGVGKLRDSPPTTAAQRSRSKERADGDANLRSSAETAATAQATPKAQIVSAAGRRWSDGTVAAAYVAVKGAIAAGARAVAASEGTLSAANAAPTMLPELKHGQPAGGQDATVDSAADQAHANELREAEIQLIPAASGHRALSASEGSVRKVARLRHPEGAEAIVDLRDGAVLCWTLPGGKVIQAGSVPLLWPEPVARANAPWQVTGMDDSNNEPSVTLTCGADGSFWWRVRRTIALGSTWLREDLVVENLSNRQASFKVLEDSRGAAARRLPKEVEELACVKAARAAVARGAKQCQLHRLQAAPSGALEAVPASGRWNTTQRWDTKLEKARRTLDAGDQSQGDQSPSRKSESGRKKSQHAKVA
eukprot:gnl/TRDRNA2_/TRDRNA2_67744_c0_seq1.p1 gnl/TRDRNA2_/TRDRNA2_67744_c0~~gnl/TRDRNA2_/TRDRNA2_67744_c0_seq1.p1  ORF type:complete len:569 (-),score=109.92 gnl/TRDRNA2_/TRDRNA2_67744_c0_seq1:17-1651(-)